MGVLTHNQVSPVDQDHMGVLTHDQGSPVDQGQDVEHGGHVGVVVARGLLQVLQGLLAEGHGHLVAALRRVLDHQVVEGPQAGWDLVAPLLGGGGGTAVPRLGHWGRTFGLRLRYLRLVLRELVP